MESVGEVRYAWGVEISSIIYSIRNNRSQWFIRTIAHSHPSSPHIHPSHTHSLTLTPFTPIPLTLTPHPSLLTITSSSLHSLITPHTHPLTLPPHPIPLTFTHHPSHSPTHPLPLTLTPHTLTPSWPVVGSRTAAGRRLPPALAEGCGTSRRRRWALEQTRPGSSYLV